MNKSIVFFFIYLNLIMGNGFDSQFRMARNNVDQIKKAITETPKDQLEGMTWLVTNMQEEDLRTLSADFLLTNCKMAYDVWENNQWGKKIPEDIFLNFLLPYASLNERRDNWRKDFKNRFFPIIQNQNPYMRLQHY
jgi:hypothetical protein